MIKLIILTFFYVQFFLFWCLVIWQLKGEKFMKISSFSISLHAFSVFLKNELKTSKKKNESNVLSNAAMSIFIFAQCLIHLLLFNKSDGKKSNKEFICYLLQNFAPSEATFSLGHVIFTKTNNNFNLIQYSFPSIYLFFSSEKRRNFVWPFNMYFSPL